MEISEINTINKTKENFGFLAKTSSVKNKSDESIFSKKALLYGGGTVASGISLICLSRYVKDLQYLKFANLLLLLYFTYKFNKELHDMRKTSKRKRFLPEIIFNPNPHKNRG